jgi:hypothetical protein
VREIVAQFGARRPARLTAGLNKLVQLAEREWALAEARDPFRRPDQGASGLVYTWAWQRKTSVEALRYCCKPDPLIAVIGAVEAAEACADINGAGPEFIAEATRLLNLDPGSRAHERSPLPDSPTAEQRADQLKNELTRIAEFEAAEKPWSLELPDDTWTV